MGIRLLITIKTHKSEEWVSWPTRQMDKPAEAGGLASQLHLTLSPETAFLPVEEVTWDNIFM